MSISVVYCHLSLVNAMNMNVSDVLVERFVASCLVLEHATVILRDCLQFRVIIRRRRRWPGWLKGGNITRD